VTKIYCFFGLAGYYRCFVQDFSSIAKSLTRHIEKGDYFEWDNDCEVMRTCHRF
jgi:hypothetical protein